MRGNAPGLEHVGALTCSYEPIRAYMLLARIESSTPLQGAENLARTSPPRLYSALRPAELLATFKPGSCWMSEAAAPLGAALLGFVYALPHLNRSGGAPFSSLVHLHRSAANRRSRRSAELTLDAGSPDHIDSQQRRRSQQRRKMPSSC